MTSLLAVALLLGSDPRAVPGHPTPAPARPTAPVAAPVKAPPVAAPVKAPAPAPEEVAPPAENDSDRERLARLQEALSSIVHGPVLGRLHVGVRVMDLGSGRVLFGQRESALMDPASNQKVLATATALLRLGGSWQFRTELAGPPPDGDGTIVGDVVLRGSGDPSLRAPHLDEMAAALAARGVTRITGAVLADPRRLGNDDAATDAHASLRVNRSAIEIRVRPGDKEGAAALVTVRPSSEAFLVENHARTGGRGRSRITVAVATAGGRIRVSVAGRVPQRHPGLVVRRLPPNQALYAAILLRGALAQAGIQVQGSAGLFVPRAHEPRRTALAPRTSDVSPPLDPPRFASLAVHESDPLPILMRRINKDSDNEWAERLLETVGAEIYGGPSTPAKGVRALREAITELGLSPKDYVPVNGSGLGHANRITPEAMADLLRRLFLDPRLGPDMVQSLSVGGVDGTTRNRFRGSPAAERVRAKTGTLNGKSCLSGYVGDGSDILVFSIMVQGLRARALASVRHAQVTAVNAMMRYARGAIGSAPAEEVASGVDFESGDEAGDSESEESGDGAPGAESPAAEDSLDQMVHKALKQLDERAPAAAQPLPAAKSGAPVKPAAAQPVPAAKSGAPIKPAAASPAQPAAPGPAAASSVVPARPTSVQPPPLHL